MTTELRFLHSLRMVCLLKRRCLTRLFHRYGIGGNDRALCFHLATNLSRYKGYVGCKIMKEKSQLWLVALLLVGLIGAGNTSLLILLRITNWIKKRLCCTVMR